MAASTALKALEADARAPAGEFVVVPLKGQDVRVKALMDWDTAALDDLQNTKLEAWARASLFGDDFATIWKLLRPTIREASDFLEAWGKTTGETPGD